ncbi:hypothetical protein AVEN_104983-1, partial [Araneus ventricosus]
VFVSSHYVILRSSEIALRLGQSLATVEIHVISSRPRG